jgi:hypothetical protein
VRAAAASVLLSRSAAPADKHRRELKDQTRYMFASERRDWVAHAVQASPVWRPGEAVLPAQR